MSYNMIQQDTQFFMDKSNLDAACKALRSVATDFKWFDMSDDYSLENSVYQFGWSLNFDDNGNVNDIEHLLEYAGDEKRLFDAIAPYVKSGSYIQMVGEDDAIWRWFFDGTRCIKQIPTFIWNAVEDEEDT